MNDQQPEPPKPDAPVEPSSGPIMTTTPQTPAPGAQPGAPVPLISEIEVEDLRAKAAEADDLKSRWLRTRADFENYQKRVARDREKDRAESVRKILLDLVQIVDNVDLVIQKARSAVELARQTNPSVPSDPLLSAIETGIRGELLATLTRNGVSLIAIKECDPYQPDIHQAVTSVDVPGLARDEIGAVMRAGYRLGTGILRPATVGVRRAVPEMKTEPPTESPKAEQSPESPKET
jgi:molecular chaperone GrpE